MGERYDMSGSRRTRAGESRDAVAPDVDRAPKEQILPGISQASRTARARRLWKVTGVPVRRRGKPALHGVNLSGARFPGGDRGGGQQLRALPIQTSEAL